jgi:hypothetical protein|tara:strand:- start:64 stop:954 length:891 start_codon:yes stop_codon:yes gene_type:complete
MAVTESRVLPAEFIEAGGKTFLDMLSKAVGQYGSADLKKVFGPQFVAGQDPLQAQAQKLAVSGIGAYKPFIQQAQDAQKEAGVLAGKAGQFMGPSAYKQFMSPYQQDVIDTTLSEFDIQAKKGAQGVPAAAIAAGAFGGGREGVQRAEFQSSSDRNRAGIQAQLLQQGFGQAQQAANQAFNQQQALANQQLGLGSAALGIGQTQQGFMGQDIGALSTLGAQNQALKQAQLQAQQQLAQQQLQQPLTAAQTYGSGVTGLIAGYPGQTTQINQPSPSPLMSAIGAGGTLAGIYRAFNK